MSGKFVSADIEKIENFEKQSQEAITEFNAIKEKFSEINKALRSKWEGEGAEAYSNEVNNILENIGGIGDILDSINNGVVKDIKDNYNKLDEDLAEFNRNPQTEE